MSKQSNILKLTTDYPDTPPSPVSSPESSIDSIAADFPNLTSSQKIKRFTTDFSDISPSPITASRASTSNISPSPITASRASTLSSPIPFTTSYTMSPSPITIPKFNRKTVQFQPNLHYNNVDDIFWYNNSPITESQYIWLNERLNAKLDIPIDLSYQRKKILYKEEDGTCWFKGHSIQCNTYNKLLNIQENHKKYLKEVKFTKPGLYIDPLAKYTGEHIKENINEERWEQWKDGNLWSIQYKGENIYMGSTEDINQDKFNINWYKNKQKRNQVDKNIFEFIRRAYANNKKVLDEINNNIEIYNEFKDFSIIPNEFSNLTPQQQSSFKKNKEIFDTATQYLQDKFDESDDYSVGGKKRKQTRKRKKSKRKTNKKRKSNNQRKSCKK